LKKIILLLIFIIFIIALGFSAGSENSIRQITGKVVLINDIEKNISKIMEKAGVSGLSCAVINDSEIVYKMAFGFRDKITASHE